MEYRFQSRHAETHAYYVTWQMHISLTWVSWKEHHLPIHWFHCTRHADNTCKLLGTYKELQMMKSDEIDDSLTISPSQSLGHIPVFSHCSTFFLVFFDLCQSFVALFSPCLPVVCDSHYSVNGQACFFGFCVATQYCQRNYESSDPLTKPPIHIS
jgi:hypothetical protein